MRTLRLAIGLIVVTFVGAALMSPPGVPTVEAATNCETEYVKHLGPACRLPDGHYQVLLEDGAWLTTHGPDYAIPDMDVGFGPNAEQRQPICTETHHFQALYGYPPSIASRYLEVVESLRDALRRMNAILNADAKASGGVGADFNVMCDGNGDIRFDEFKGPETGGNVYTTDFSAIVSAARQQGYANPTTDYVIFYDDSSDGVCGVGNLVSDDRPSADNGNMKGPHYGVSYKSCWYGRTPMHENGHNQGAVQRLAPMWDGSGHCLEGRDVMCYPSEGGVLPLCGDRTHYDCGFDTYFDASPEAGEWLATHWNIGSSLNKYITFHQAPPRPPPPTTASPSSTSAAPSPTTTAPPTSSSPPTTSAPPTTTPPTSAPPTSEPPPTSSSSSPGPTETTPSGETEVAEREESSTKELDVQGFEDATVPGLGVLVVLGGLVGVAVFVARRRA